MKWLTTLSSHQPTTSHCYKMFNGKALLFFTVVAVCGLASANPVNGPVTESTGVVKICTRDVTSPGCTDVAFNSGHCYNLDDGLSFFDKQISAVVVSAGHGCTFFEEYNCDTLGSHGNSNGDVYLAEGTWNMNSVPGPDGTENFNDLASSFTCSRV
ncbi:hypothetical protein R3P38DRAFT_2871584 [Favolaschia claudopus]|uniref:Uncharacterized protein n=1 Tax=Favolaschia claudopus TaxID=2862362 RepID=A0AAW0DBK4_9AGAR